MSLVKLENGVSCDLPATRKDPSTWARLPGAQKALPFIIDDSSDEEKTQQPTGSVDEADKQTFIDKSYATLSKTPQQLKSQQLRMENSEKRKERIESRTQKFTPPTTPRSESKTMTPEPGRSSYGNGSIQDAALLRQRSPDVFHRYADDQTASSKLFVPFSTNSSYRSLDTQQRTQHRHRVTVFAPGKKYPKRALQSRAHEDAAERKRQRLADDRAAIQQHKWHQIQNRDVTNVVPQPTHSDGARKALRTHNSRYPNQQPQGLSLTATTQVSTHNAQPHANGTQSIIRDSSQNQLNQSVGTVNPQDPKSLNDLVRRNGVQQQTPQPSQLEPAQPHVVLPRTTAKTGYWRHAGRFTSADAIMVKWRQENRSWSDVHNMYVLHRQKDLKLTTLRSKYSATVKAINQIGVSQQLIDQAATGDESAVALINHLIQSVGQDDNAAGAQVVSATSRDVANGMHRNTQDAVCSQAATTRPTVGGKTLNEPFFIHFGESYAAMRAAEDAEADEAEHQARQSEDEPLSPEDSCFYTYQVLRRQCRLEEIEDDSESEGGEDTATNEEKLSRAIDKEPWKQINDSHTSIKAANKAACREIYNNRTFVVDNQSGVTTRYEVDQDTGAVSLTLTNPEVGKVQVHVERAVKEYHSRPVDPPNKESLMSRTLYQVRKKTRETNAASHATEIRSLPVDNLVFSMLYAANAAACQAFVHAIFRSQSVNHDQRHREKQVLSDERWVRFMLDAGGEDNGKLFKDSHCEDMGDRVIETSVEVVPLRLQGPRNM